MNPERRRELTLAAAAVVLLAIAAWMLLPDTPRSSGAAASSNAATANGPVRPKSPIVELNLKALEAERPQPDDSTRNPFRFKPTPPPPPPPRPPEGLKKQEEQAAAEQAARFPAEPLPPPRIPLKYIGDMMDPKNPGKRIAILSDARSTYYGREGEVVEGRYRIVRIGVESIELAYLDGRGRQTIRQTGQ
jgi:hypothetical protein